MATQTAQQPIDIKLQLLCFHAFQHHSVVECLLEAFLRDPVTPHHQLFIHDGYLAGRGRFGFWWPSVNRSVRPRRLRIDF